MFRLLRPYSWYSSVRATYPSPTSSSHIVKCFCYDRFANCFSLERVWLVIFHLNSDRNKVIRASVRTRNSTSGTNFRPVNHCSTSFGLWLVEKLQNLITDPEFRASAKGTISYYGAGIRPVLWSLRCADSNVAHSSMITEDTWAASSANVYTGGFLWQ